MPLVATRYRSFPKIENSVRYEQLVLGTLDGPEDVASYMVELPVYEIDQLIPNDAVRAALRRKREVEDNDDLDYFVDVIVHHDGTLLSAEDVTPTITFE
jgi:hypothetical protein